jgi:hypothetical protein
LKTLIGCFGIYLSSKIVLKIFWNVIKTRKVHLDDYKNKINNEVQFNEYAIIANALYQISDNLIKELLEHQYKVLLIDSRKNKEQLNSIKKNIEVFYLNKYNIADKIAIKTINNDKIANLSSVEMEKVLKKKIMSVVKENKISVLINLHQTNKAPSQNITKDAITSLFIFSHLTQIIIKRMLVFRGKSLILHLTQRNNKDPMSSFCTTLHDRLRDEYSGKIDVITLNLYQSFNTNSNLRLECTTLKKRVNYFEHYLSRRYLYYLLYKIYKL